MESIRVTHPDQDLGPVVLTIGNFDGCHLGHQKLIQTTLDLADKTGVVPASLTFDPRPELYFQKAAPALDNLFTEDQKTRAFQELGLRAHFVQSFNDVISRMQPRAFYEEVLIKQLKAKAIVVGENFRFGHCRAGDTSSLKEFGDEAGVSTHVVSSAASKSGVVSSTKIRAALRQGDLSTANAMLGRPYLIEGMLQKGDQLGRTIGFPTLNLSCETQMIPQNGVYAGFAWYQSSKEDAPTIIRIDAAAKPVAINIGVRPTVSGLSLRVEGHLLGTEAQNIPDNLYDIRAGFYLVEKIRDEQKFPSLDDLKAQIKKDVAKATSILNQVSF